MAKLVFGLNFLDAFIVGIMTVMVPLLMVAHGIDVATIGIVFSLSPLFGLIVRLLGAAIGDMFGERIIYSFNAVSNFAQACAYAYMPTAAGFGIGKMLDGARGNLIFAVNRTSAIASAPEKKHYQMANMMSGRIVYTALGSLAVGMLFSIGGFGMLLALVASISAFMLLFSLGVRNSHRPGTRVRLSDLSPLGRSRRFNEISGNMVVGTALYVMALYITIPLFFAASGYSLAQIGVLYAAYYLIEGVGLSILSNRGVKSKSIAWLCGGLFFFSILGMAFGGAQLLWAFFLLMAIADACGTLLWEELNYFVARKSSKRSVDIAAATTPSIISMVIASAASGFALNAFGFPPLFALFALSQVAFVAWFLRIEGMKD